jgi:exodeoxyribonuclease-3
MDAFTSNGLFDTFRALYGEEVKYSWWSYRAGAREKNVGWRIDYFLASESLMSRIKSAFIMNDIFGSDHCPVGVEIQ